MFALVDCNNFFVSVERVFRPELRNQPVCVLSNNDGCIVALSNEAKSIGLKRGDPFFRVRDIIRRNKVTVFSSNYSLYAGMSSRVMQVLSDSFPEVEIYSIDEAFIILDDAPVEEVQKNMLALKRKLRVWTGIPVSIGVAPTKTLAKVAGHFAKKFPGYEGVCVMDSEDKRVKALKLLPIREVWGIGRRSQAKLEKERIYSAWEFTQMNESWVNQHFSTIGVRTYKELLGIPCVQTGEIETKQSICTSRSFGTCVESKDQLLSAVVSFAASCAQKLRAQHAVSNIISIFIATDRFKTDCPQYRQFVTMKLPLSTADTSELIRYAQTLLFSVFKAGYLYKKAGVIVSGITPDMAIQQDIFDEVTQRGKRQQLFHAIDKINASNGPGTVKFAIQEEKSSQWSSRREHVSRDYLNNVNDLLEVH